ncbi:MAG: fibronectin type III domain-containing protein [Candidatus Hatepunaea meridiana]|nr:fibronectin type III domain-containing protein [Candidatus Hatepunaea meridiana]
MKRQMVLSQSPIVGPFIPEVVNPPDGDGKSLLIIWSKPPGKVIDGYIIERATVSKKKWIQVGEASGDDTSFVDRDRPDAGFRLLTGVNYKYRIITKVQGWKTISLVSEEAVAKPRWFNVQRANVFFVILVYFGSVLFYIDRTRKGKSLFIRRIAGMEAMDEALGRATEMGRPALYIPGIMDVDNIQTIASMVILTEVSKRCAEYDIQLIVPLNRAFVVPLAEESVKEGFLRSGRPDAYNPDDIRYLSDEQFAFTAGVTGIMNRQKTAAHFFLGAFFAESLIVSEIGFSTGAIQIAGTANIHQLPFFVVACDYTLIGEEFYAASAYISKEPQLLGTLKGADLMKLLMMGAVFVGSMLSWVGVEWVVRIFGV